MVFKKFSIYIDGLFFKGSGIGRYYESLVKEMSLKGMTIYTCVPIWLKDDFEENFKNYNNINAIYVNYSKYSLKGFVMQSAILRKLEKKVDLFFYPHINLPMYIPKNTIITVHDLTQFTKFWDRNVFKKKYYKFIFERAINQCKGIIVISEATKKDLIKFDKTVESKIKVIYRFIDDKFIKSGKTGNFNVKPLINGNYVLFIGNRKKHKNLENLIKSFNLIKDKISHKLVIAGSKDTGKDCDEIDTLIKNFNLKDRIIEFLSPDDATIMNLYKNADLFVFPSLIEGFGLPPIEAVSLNCPSILSDIPISKEIFGNCADYFDPYSIQDMGEKIFYLLNNESYRIEYLKKQQERIKLFNKDKIINEHIDFFYYITKEN